MTLTGDTGFNRARGAWRIPRSRGALSGLLLMLLGAWGALIPFIGPAFSFGFGGTATWAWTAARFWLEVLPGIACVVGGLMLTLSANRGTTLLGAWLAMAAGAWFVIGPTVAGPLHLGDIGVPMGGPTRVAWTWLLFFYLLGAAVLALAAAAHGRLSVRSVRDVEHAALRARSKQLAKEQGGLFGPTRGRGRGREREPAGRYSSANDVDRADQARRGEHTVVYPADSAAGRDVQSGGPTSRDTGRRAEETTVYPSDTTRADDSVHGRSDAARGRHEGTHDGLGERIGRTLAKHGIGGKHSRS